MQKLNDLRSKNSRNNLNSHNKSDGKTRSVSKNSNYNSNDNRSNMTNAKNVHLQNTNTNNQGSQNYNNDTSGSASKISLLQTQIQVQKQEIEDWKNKTLRVAADLQNVQKQSELEMQQSVKKGKKSIMNLVVPFLNTINLAMSFKPQTTEEGVIKFIEAMKGSYEKLIHDLEGVGVEVIVPQSGQIFDPNTMTALNQAEDEEVTVKQIVGVGVKIDGQLVQSATVIV